MIVDTHPRDGARLKDWLRILSRRKLSILAGLLAGAALSAFTVASSPDLYEARAVVALDARTVQVLVQDAVVSRLPQESPALRTELDIIASRSMAEAVLDRLGSGFTLPVEPTPWWRTVASQAAQAAGVPEAAILDGRVGERDRDAVVDALMANLRVSNDGGSFTIFISYVSTRPDLAAAVANAYAEGYIEVQTAQKSAATRRATEWLAVKVDEMRASVQAAETRAAIFRQDAALLEANGVTMREQRLAALNAELAAARGARAGAAARLSTARALEPTAEELGALTEALGSPVVQNLLREQEAAEEALAGLRAAGATRSAEIPRLEARIEALRGRIEMQLARIIASLANEVEAAERKEGALAEEIAALESAIAAADLDRVQLEQLEWEAAVSRQNYEALFARYRQAVEQQELVTPEARLISRARAPDVPIGRDGPVAVLALLFGLLGGVGIGVLREGLDDRIRSVGRLEAETGLPVLGLLPAVLRRRGQSLQRFPVDRPDAQPSEDLRRLLAVVRRALKARGAKVAMVTSALEDEGKTTVCLGLARAAAMAGISVVVVDADLRRPGVAPGIGLSGDGLSGLAEAVGGRQLADLLRPDSASSAVLLPAGDRRIVSAEAIFASKGFGDVLDRLAQRFDLVLVDTPPVLACSDACAIASRVETSLLVVRWGRTEAAALGAALRNLGLCGARPLGFVFNRVSRRKSKTYEAAVPPSPPGRTVATGEAA